MRDDAAPVSVHDGSTCRQGGDRADPGRSRLLRRSRRPACLCCCVSAWVTVLFVFAVANGPAQAGARGSSADVGVTLADSPDPVAAGHILSYTASVRNGGPGTATGVSLTNALGANVTLVEVSPSQGNCTGSSTISCNLGRLERDRTATVRIDVRPGQEGALRNTVGVKAKEADPAQADNKATADTTVTPGADLRLTKQDSPDPVISGKEVTYTLTVTNAGPSTATEVELGDLLPRNTTFVSASAGCTGDPSVICEIGTLAAGATAQRTIVVRTKSTGVAENHAWASAKEPDPDQANDSPTATTQIQPSGNSAGALDSSFDGDGVMNAGVKVVDMVVQPDGKIVVVGRAGYGGDPDYGAIVVKRFNTDGSPDSSFHHDGKQAIRVCSDRYPTGVALAPDDSSAPRIVIGGYAFCSDPVSGLSYRAMTVVRLTPSGELDSSFGDPAISGAPGVTHTRLADGELAGLDLLVRPDGAVGIVGDKFDHTIDCLSVSDCNADFALAQFTADGRLDAGFGNRGIVTTDFTETMAAATSKIDYDGSFDIAGAIAHQGERYLTGGYAYARGEALAMARFLESGALDPAFGLAGKLVIPRFRRANAIAVDASGSIVVAGVAGCPDGGYSCGAHWRVARLHADGAVDRWFEDTGLYSGARALAAQRTSAGDELTVVAGWGGVARYQADGSLDPTFGNGGIALPQGAGDCYDARAVAVDAVNRIITAGGSCVARLKGA